MAKYIVDIAYLDLHVVLLIIFSHYSYFMTSFSLITLLITTGEDEGGVGTMKMATTRPKSPRPNTPRKDEANESFWDKIGTLGRKKKIKEGKGSW